MNRHILIIMIAASVRIAMPAQNLNDMENKFVISCNGKEMTATFASNSSAEAFRTLIADAPLTLEMSDYGDFEKVGSLGHTLPTNDTRITTQPGDVILYLGSNITIYYDVNTWAFTRLGKIDGNPTRESILSVLGSGTANVTFSVSRGSASVSELALDSAALDVHVSGRVITVAANDGEKLRSVYDLAGKCIYHGFDSEISLPGSGIYMIKSGSRRAKVMVK